MIIKNQSIHDLGQLVLSKYMKQGLKQKLNKLIKEKGEVMISEIHEFAYLNGYKQSNAERQLRPSQSPMVKSIKNEKGHIVAYKWLGIDNVANDKKTTQIEDLGQQREIFSKVRLNPYHNN